MAAGFSRQFFERAFSFYTKGKMDQFFEHVDPQVKWVIHGENLFTGTYSNLQQVKEGFQRFYQLLSEHPKQNLRYLIIEGAQAAAFLYDDVIGKDGKRYRLEYWLMLELSKEGDKIVKVDNFMDSLQMHNIVKASEKQRLSA